MNSAVPSHLYEILNESVNGHLENFTITFDDGNKKGDGFLGQIFFITLTNKRNGKQLSVVVKQAFLEKTIRESTSIREIFLNEIYFYTKLWSKFENFQDNIPQRCQFNNIAKCLAAISEDNSEKLVLENLKHQGYELHPKKIPLDKEKFEFIFKSYGRFHALSIAYKALHPVEFSEIAKNIVDIWKVFLNTGVMQNYIKDTYRIVLNNFQSSGKDEEILEKFKHYSNDGVKLFNNSLISNKDSIFINGDCWSNNMMFKYDDYNKLIDVKFLDFQLSKLGSPVCDLSYCLYSGGTKETFDQLNHLLQVYHDTLSESLRAFGCNPDELYPLDTLKSDWKVYCQFGVAMGLSIWRGKLAYEDEIVDSTDATGNIEEDAEKFRQVKFDTETFEKRSRDVILHLFENDYLM